MRRRVPLPLVPIEHRCSIAAPEQIKAFDEALGPITPKKKRKPNAKALLDRALDELPKQAASDWAKAEPRHFVALYAHCHEHTYGVFPAEIVRAYPMAVRAALRMLEQEFGGFSVKFADYMRWVWNRELDIEKKARKNGNHRRRVTWQLCFVPDYLLTDFRLEKIRENDRGEGKGK